MWNCKSKRICGMGSVRILQMHHCLCSVISRSLSLVHSFIHSSTENLLKSAMCSVTLPINSRIPQNTLLIPKSNSKVHTHPLFSIAKTTHSSVALSAKSPYYVKCLTNAEIKQTIDGLFTLFARRCRRVPPASWRSHVRCSQSPFRRQRARQRYRQSWWNFRHGTHHRSRRHPNLLLLLLQH